MDIRGGTEVEIRQLEYFLDICRMGSIGQAAKKHYISQQGMSRTISSMEQELGVRLFYRSANGVSPTTEGEIFYKNAATICNIYETMRKELGMILENQHEQVHISYAYGVLSQMSLDLPNRFRIEHPEIDLFISECPFHSAERMLAEKKVDLAFAYLPIERDNFEFKPLYQAPWPLLVHRDSPLAKKNMVTCQDIASENLVLMSESFKGHFTFLSRCKSLGIKLNIIANINDLSESYQWVRDNAAVAFTTYRAAGEITDPNIRVIPLADEVCTATIGILRRAGENLSPVAQLFYDYVCQEFERERSCSPPPQTLAV